MNSCKLFIRTVLITALLSIVQTTWASANMNLFKLADQHAESGNAEDMLTTYEQILIKEPSNIRALNGKATALSWLNKLTHAQQVYLKALSLEPNNVESLTGLGYTYAWDNQHDKAIKAFTHASTNSPQTTNGQKELAFSRSWAGHHQQSLNMFSSLQYTYSNNAEILNRTSHTRIA